MRKHYCASYQIKRINPFPNYYGLRLSALAIPPFQIRCKYVPKNGRNSVSYFPMVSGSSTNLDENTPLATRRN